MDLFLHFALGVDFRLICISYLMFSQTCSQAEARKHGFQHHMGLDVRKSDFVAWEHQRHRPACASAQFDQHLCYSLSEK